eukprot:Hpha_TRINITY_DN8656_c0_g1::TRINITY_DN8656_c0_g1_i1::g.168775::m.168775
MVVSSSQDPGTLGAVLCDLANELDAGDGKNVLREPSMARASEAILRSAKSGPTSPAQWLEVRAALAAGLEPVRGCRLRIQAHALCATYAFAAAASTGSWAEGSPKAETALWEVLGPVDGRKAEWRRHSSPSERLSEEEMPLAPETLIRGTVDGDWLQAPGGLCVSAHAVRRVEDTEGTRQRGAAARRWAGVTAAMISNDELRRDERLWRNVGKHLAAPGPVLTDNQTELCWCWLELQLALLFAASVCVTTREATRSGIHSSGPPSEEVVAMQQVTLCSALGQGLSCVDDRTRAAVNKMQAARRMQTPQYVCDSIGAAAARTQRLTGVWPQGARLCLS